MTTWKLQKLVYYCQAWSLVWDENVLFPEEIEAWANGPVVREVYQAHHGEYRVSHLPGGDAAALTATQREAVDAVLTILWRPIATVAERPHACGIALAVGPTRVAGRRTRRHRHHEGESGRVLRQPVGRAMSDKSKKQPRSSAPRPNPGIPVPHPAPIRRGMNRKLSCGCSASRICTEPGGGAAKRVGSGGTNSRPSSGTSRPRLWKRSWPRSEAGRGATTTSSPSRDFPIRPAHELSKLGSMTFRSCFRRQPAGRFLAHQACLGMMHLAGRHPVQAQPRNRRIHARAVAHVRRHQRRSEWFRRTSANSGLRHLYVHRADPGQTLTLGKVAVAHHPATTVQQSLRLKRGPMLLELRRHRRRDQSSGTDAQELSEGAGNAAGAASETTLSLLMCGVLLLPKP